MRLPAHLLSQLRIGACTGAVLLAGCDLVQGIAGDAPDAGPNQAAESAPAPAPAAAPAAEERPDSSSGIAGAVARVVESSKPRQSDPPPLLREDPTEFVPFESAGTRVRPRAEAPLSFAAPTSRPKRKPKRVAAIVDEPCDPGVDPGLVGVKTEWQCPACGRG